MDIDHPMNVLAVGKKKSGKTNLIKHLLLRNSLYNQYFQFGMVFTNTKFDEEYSYLPDRYVIDGFDIEKFEEYRRHVQDMEEIQPNFLIMDDLVAVVKDQPEFVNFICNHRHYKTSVMVSAQYFRRGVPTALRENTDVAFFFRTMNEGTLKSLWESYGQIVPKFKEWKGVFLENTREKFACIRYLGDGEMDRDEIFQVYKAPDMSKGRKYKIEY